MNRERRFLSCLSFILILILAASVQSAQFEILKDGSLLGTLDQRNVPTIGDQACAPTSAVNNFVYLEQQYPNLFNRSLIPDLNEDGEYDEAELIAVATILGSADYMATSPVSGTGDSRMIYGKYKYMKEVSPNGVTLGGYDNGPWDGPGDPPEDVVNGDWPDWQNIYDALSACYAVEVGFIWDGGGGHWVSAYGMTFDDVTNTGTMTFVDPWGGISITGDLTLDGSGHLEVTYSGDVTDNNLATGTIDIFVFQIPEPATAVFFLLLLAGSLWRTRILAP